MGGSKLSGFKKFVKSLTKKDRIALLYHSDADGLCSAVIAVKAIEKIRGRKPELVFYQIPVSVELSRKTISLLRKKRINRLISVDIAIDQKADAVRKVAKFADILILDHHKKYHTFKEKNILMLKANDVAKGDGADYPLSKMSYDLFSKLCDIKKLKWVSAVGIIGDSGLDRWKKFIDSAAKESKLSIDDLKQMKEIVSSVEAATLEKFSGLFNEFYKTKNPRKLLKSKFLKYSKDLHEEIYRHLVMLPSKAEFYPEKDLVFYIIKSKTGIKSPLVNKISHSLFPDKTVILVQDSGKKMLKVSARRQDRKVKVNDLLEKAVNGLKGATAGGHIPAAAGEFQRKDLRKFKKRLISELS